MPMASRRDDPDGAYQTFFARRSGPDGAFGTPDRSPLAALEQDGRALVDAFLSDDGRFLFFNRSQANGEGDLFMSWRTNLDESFEQEVDLVVNTPADERDPWLNPDGTRFFFSRDSEERGLDIYGTAIDLTLFR
jgi:hypothetical protein